MRLHATCLGYPRIGRRRELKKVVEAFWAGRSTAGDLVAAGEALRNENWTAMRRAGLTSVPVGDFSLYDHVLDTAFMLGVIPARFSAIADPLLRYFAMARGRQDDGVDIPALEMTKWFDTNYHYIVPELADDQTFQLNAAKILDEIAQVRRLGLEPRPVVLGPVTFLRLSKMAAGATRRTLDFLPDLMGSYVQLLRALADEEVSWVQVDDPCLATDLDDEWKAAYGEGLAVLSGVSNRPRLLLTTYFGPLADNLPIAIASGFEGLHVDLVRAADQIDGVLDAWPADRVLSIGLVDGRNVWRTDLDTAAAVVQRVVENRDADRVWISSSCSLLHTPVDLEQETALDKELRSWLAFACQKLDEIAVLAGIAPTEYAGDLRADARAALETRRTSPRTLAPSVRQRLVALETEDVRRSLPFDARWKRQADRLQLLTFPTTTIGSFPQTTAVREARASWRAGRLSDADYQAFLEQETRSCVSRQEALDLDVLVHGEFERNDMVEYFGEQLSGFAFTEFGWVQSYGSRCVKPPIIYGDVSRPHAMTVDWARFAQSLTTRPMKGMLTGPVTILQWSFVRDDQPRRDTCLQIALALRDEVHDLEAAGIGVIQVDEPAIREGLPLRQADREHYLAWAVRAFHVATGRAAPPTQIHTHMCYSEFGDILPAVAALDADVISIETSRSRMELLDDFADFAYPNAIGPGVYDIHSPRVPTVAEIVDLLERATQVVPIERIWVNPDCGLKTRGWTEVEAALRNMVAAAKQMRRQHA